MFLMNCFCNKASIRSHHETPKFRIDSNISHSCRNKNLIICLFYSCTDCHDIIWFLIWAICNTDTT